MRTIIAVLLILVNTPLLADYPLEIIELKGLPVSEVLPIIRPFVDSDGAVSGMNNQLILRTSPNSLRDIRAILNRIDTPPRRLLISVRQGQQSDRHAEGIAIDIDATTGERSKVIVGRPGADGTIHLRGLNADTGNDTNLVSRIQTIEGKPAFIATGQSTPVTTYRSFGDGDYRHFQSNTQYRDATAGFYALPRVNAQHVTVEISPHMNRSGGAPGSFDVMRAGTLVSGQLGEWIRLGGVSDTQTIQQGTIGFKASRRQHREIDIWLKIDEIE